MKKSLRLLTLIIINNIVIILCSWIWLRYKFLNIDIDNMMVATRVGLLQYVTTITLLIINNILGIITLVIRGQHNKYIAGIICFIAIPYVYIQSYSGILITIRMIIGYFIIALISIILYRYIIDKE